LVCHGLVFHDGKHDVLDGEVLEADAVFVYGGGDVYSLWGVLAVIACIQILRAEVKGLHLARVVALYDFRGYFSRRRVVVVIIAAGGEAQRTTYEGHQGQNTNRLKAFLHFLFCFYE